MKKKILVPVDYSKTAQNAFKYALAWAQEQDAIVEVFHVYSGSFSLDELPTMQLSKGREEVLIDRLKEFCMIPEASTATVATELLINYKVMLDPATADSIVNRAEEIAADFIVMGTKGTHDLLERWLGSVSTSVAQGATCPVFLIPKDCTFQPFQHILYASNFESVAPKLIATITDWAKAFEAMVHFIHVDDIPGRPAEEFDELEDKIFQQLFAEGDPTFSFNLATIHARSVHQGLKQYADENAIDVMVLVNRQRRFWDNLLGESLTKDMALTTTLPLLVLHYFAKN